MRLQRIATILAVGTLLSPSASVTKQTVGGSQLPAVVSATEPPAGMESFPVTWHRVTVPNLGTLRAAVARPPGAGPFPVVPLLHGTHGFAREYVEWANDLSRGGFITLAVCWFSGSGGAGVNEVTPIPCPDIPPLASGEYPEAVQILNAVTQAARSLPGVDANRLALVGHSRGAGAVQQFLMAGGNAQAAVLHSSGYGLRPWERAAEFNAPMLIMHGTADSFGQNTQVALARRFEASLIANHKPIQAAYCEGCGHNTFFTSATQRDQELKTMIAFLRRHLNR